MNMQSLGSEISSIGYETDYYLWLQTTRNQIARHDFAAIDVGHLLEEIDDLSRRGIPGTA